MVGQIAGRAICGVHSCCGLALCYGYSTDTKSRYLSVSLFLLLSEADDVHHSHTCVSASTPSHPRFYWVPLITSVSGTREDMRVFYVRLITLTLSVQCLSNSDPYLDYRFFLLCWLACPRFQKVFGTKTRRDHVNAVWFWGFQNVPEAAHQKCVCRLRIACQPIIYIGLPAAWAEPPTVYNFMRFFVPEKPGEGGTVLLCSIMNEGDL